MSAASTIQPINNSNRWVSFDIKGNPDEASSREDVKSVALNAERHYALWNRLPFKNYKEQGIKKGVGPGLLIALFETVAAYILQRLERTPATFTNLFTTLSELAQVIIANITAPGIYINDIEDEKKKEEEKQKQKFLATIRENAVSGVIATAGAVGLYKWFREILGVLKGEEVEIADLSIVQKSSLSLASFLSSIGMFVGYGEKGAFAPVAKNSVNKGEIEKSRAKEMRANSRSDFRCSIEWLVMTVFPFVVQIRPIKVIIDFVIPAAALLDGAGDLYEWGSVKFNNGHDHKHHEGQDHECNHGFTGLINKGMQFVKKILGIKDDGKKTFSIPKIFFNTWYFGTEKDNGIRSWMLPFYKLLGCTPPECFMRSKRLYIKVPDKNGS